MVGEPEVIIVLLIYGITSKTHESFWANPIYLTTNVPTLTKRHKRRTIQQRGQLEDDRGPGVTWRESHVSFAATKCVLPVSTLYPGERGRT